MIFFSCGDRMKNLIDKLPADIWNLIFTFDSTFRDFFSKKVLPELELYRSRRLAKYYIGIPCQCYKSYFRYFNNRKWYTISFIEISLNKYQICRMDEKTGTSFLHLFNIMQKKNEHRTNTIR